MCCNNSNCNNSCGCREVITKRGEKGEQGVVGPPGAQGVPGADGIQGPQGIQGIQGIQGDPGPDFTWSGSVVPAVYGGVAGAGAVLGSANVDYAISGKTMIVNYRVLATLTGNIGDTIDLTLDLDSILPTNIALNGYSMGAYRSSVTDLIHASVAQAGALRALYITPSVLNKNYAGDAFNAYGQIVFYLL